MHLTLTFQTPHWISTLPAEARICVFGGHIRDRFLNLPSRDIDYLVSGVDVSDFPSTVFQYYPHPVTDRFILQDPLNPTDAQYEIMLAKRVSGVALEDLQTSLMTRDLTIHTMGWDVREQCWIDPSNQGLQDLQKRLLRMTHTHVFGEDPNRVLRLARLSVQLEPFGFHLDNDTVETAKLAILKDGWHCEEGRLIRQMGLIWAQNPEKVFARLAEWGLLDTLGKWAERPTHSSAPKL